MPAVAQLPQAVTHTFTYTYNFPPTGFGSLETLQVNVANLASNSAKGTAASCTGNVSFYNASGTAISAATKTFTVTAGQTVSAPLLFSQTSISGTHGVVRAVVTLSITSGVPCSPQYSLETYDTSSGATHLFIAGNGPSIPIGFGR